MSDWTIYFNGKCGSCRKALALLEEGGIQPRIIEYLKTPPTAAEIKQILAGLEGGPEDLIRKKEPAFDALKITGPLTASEIADAIVRHPILLQRPVVVKGKKAMIARPPERVKTWLPRESA